MKIVTISYFTVYPIQFVDIMLINISLKIKLNNQVRLCSISVRNIIQKIKSVLKYDIQ